MSAACHALAEETYRNAVVLFNRKFTKSEDKEKWLSDKHTLADVENVLLAAKANYEIRTGSRARNYINRISAGIMYYGNVMDMLVQHHPEYVSLGWGTMKLLFVVRPKLRILGSTRALITMVAGTKSRGACDRACESNGKSF